MMLQQYVVLLRLVLTALNCLAAPSFYCWQTTKDSTVFVSSPLFYSVYPEKCTWSTFTCVDDGARSVSIIM